MRCSQCGVEFDPATSPAMPFCSERCRSLDLGRWLDEGYSLPHVPDPDDEGGGLPPGDDWLPPGFDESLN